MIWLIRFILFSSVLLGILLNSAPTGIDLDLVNKPAFESWNNFLGCDRLGRDVFAMYSYGVVSTVLIALPARLITLIFSLCVTLFGYILGKSFGFIMDQLAYVFLSIPSLLIALLVVASLGAGFFSLPIAIVLSDWAMSYESMKAKLREIQNGGYVQASFAMGATKSHVFIYHIIPGLSSMLWYLFITGVPTVIMALAIFSYLGVNWAGDYLGPGLGEQIAFSGDYFQLSPTAVFVPVIGIILLVVGLGRK
ncbi:ABC transporter permease subunit [Leptospira sp. GIMC2001]|uniref:ABC transporter permease subunit n=1 Tax=Leptospira sp. GIMC2001 TaxID=1513297 RepID=UPI002349A17A|nr:ABC transporter permease subunit [Leptospira sp. GIMC2001]WCL51387.1 ABC transporter permease subunit [Leptospira sp. GIMC2001]